MLATTSVALPGYLDMPQSRLADLHPIVEGLDELVFFRGTDFEPPASLGTTGWSPQDTLLVRVDPWTGITPAFIAAGELGAT